MHRTITLNRRRFLQTGLQAGLLGSAALTTLPKSAFGAVTKAEHDPFDGLKMGLTTYTLRSFKTLDEAIAMTKQAGVKYISLKDVHLSLKSTAAECQAAHKQIEDAGLILMGGGVIYMKNDADQIHGIFEYARNAGMATVVCSPDPDALDTLEKTAKEYGIRVAIHNHGPGDKHYPSPFDVWRMVKDRDVHMGCCIDVGHTVRNGDDPVKAIQECAPRLYEFHMKDVTKAAGNGAPTEVGKGVIDIVAVLKTLIAVKYPYHVALEYEAHGDAPMPGVVESLAYIRGVLAAVA